MSIKYSIIVPIFNQWHYVPRLLDTLCRQTPARDDVEILLIDNGSTNFQPPAVLPGPVRILHCETPGSYAARNAGIAEARGAWLVFTDADCLPSGSWLARIDDAIASHNGPPRLLAGAIRVTADAEAPNPYQIYDMVKGIPQAQYVRRGYAATANLCVSAEVIQKIGPFDAGRFSGGDAELCRRAAAHGYRLDYLPDAVVDHPARDSWQDLVTKARRIKGGQLTAGSLQRRALYFIRSFSPPAVAAWRFLGRRDQPYRFRMVAIMVQLRIWCIDMREAVRLSFGAGPERR